MYPPGRFISPNHPTYLFPVSPSTDHKAPTQCIQNKRRYAALLASSTQAGNNLLGHAFSSGRGGPVGDRSELNSPPPSLPQSFSRPPSPVDASLVVDEIMEAYQQDILFYEKTLDAIVSHYEDEKRLVQPITEDHVKEIISIVSYYEEEKEKWILRETRPGKNGCEKGGEKQPLAGPSRHTGLTITLREGRCWETRDVMGVWYHGSVDIDDLCKRRAAVLDLVQGLEMLDEECDRRNRDYT